MVQLRRTWMRAVRRRVFAPACGRPDCQASRSARVGRRRPPIHMQHAWLCSPQCLEHEARAIFDQFASSRKTGADPGHRVPLGLLMLAHGYLNETQWQTALEAQSRARQGKIGEWLQALHFVTERQVLTALGVQWARLHPLGSFIELSV